MNPRLHQRLKALEAKRTPTTISDAERQERRELLRLTCDDAEAMNLYHRVLESMSRTCAHRDIGSCVSCFSDRQKSKEAQHALGRFYDRIHVLTHASTPQPKEQ